MARIPTMTVSFRVPASWRPLLKELIPTSTVCQNAVLMALQNHCSNRDARVLEESLAAIATGDTTRFKLKTVFPKDSPKSETPTPGRIRALVNAVHNDLGDFKVELRREEKTR